MFFWWANEFKLCSYYTTLFFNSVWQKFALGVGGTAQALPAKTASCLSSVDKQLGSQDICKFLPDTLRNQDTFASGLWTHNLFNISNTRYKHASRQLNKIWKTHKTTKQCFGGYIIRPIQYDPPCLWLWLTFILFLFYPGHNLFQGVSHVLLTNL